MANPAAARSSAFAAIDDFVASQLADARIPGAALGIVRGDQVVHLRGFGAADEQGRAVTPQTPFVIGSVSKTFTAVAIMQLVEAGRLELDAPVRRYLPGFRLADAAASAQITVRHLLHHTSGIPTLAGQLPLSEPETSLEAQVQALATVTPAASPVSGFAYSNANYEVLGLLVEVASGESYGDYVRRHIFEPLQMRHSHVEPEAAFADGLGSAHRYWFGVPYARTPHHRADFLPSAFLMASAEDLAHFLISQLNGGRYGDAVVLSPGSIAEMQRPAARLPGPAGDAAYGMGWTTSTVNGMSVVAHNGSTTEMHAMALLLPAEGWGVVLLTNAESIPYELLQRQDLIAFGVASMLTERPAMGTFNGLYLAFDAVVVVLFGLQARSLVRVLRDTPAARKDQWLGRARRIFFHGVLPIYGDLIVPVVFLVMVPGLLGAGWPVLVGTDIGLVVFAYALLRLGTGAARGARLLGRKEGRWRACPGVRSERLA
jgi:CubicO group peptidase (beta-lactamase class C family)